MKEIKLMEDTAAMLQLEANENGENEKVKSIGLHLEQLSILACQVELNLIGHNEAQRILKNIKEKVKDTIGTFNFTK